MTEHTNQNQNAPGELAEAEPRARQEAESVAEELPIDVEELQAALVEARRDSVESRDKYLRALAEMDNSRKRLERNYADASRATIKDLLRRILGVKDNLERALQYGEAGQNGESILEGVRLTQYQLEQLLEQEGVKPIEAEGKIFDPKIEEAVHTVHEPDVPDHTVTQVARRGYTYKDEVLRPAQVVVNVHE
jgi:molecular chaperone GrpE